MPSLKAKHKRWAVEYTNADALREEPNRSWRVWKWYHSDSERDIALAKLKRQGMGFAWRALDVARNEQGKKLYPKKQA